MIPNKLIIYAGAVLVALAAIGGALWYTYNAGAKNERAKYIQEQQILQRAQQTEVDKAAAILRGQVLARQQREKELNAQLANTANSLRSLRTKLQAAGTCARIDGTGGDDFLTIIGESWAEYGELGKEAARLTDKIGGLQGYINGIREARPTRQQ